jgi:hypothetical protein
VKKLFAVLILSLAILSAAPARLLAAEPETLALDAAQQFLALLDAGEIDKGFEATSAFHKEMWVKEWWVKLNGAQRAAFGPLVNRAVKSAKPATTVPRQPDGDYYLISYESSFARKAKAVEFVEVVLEKDQTWRVTEYSCN